MESSRQVSDLQRAGILVTLLTAAFVSSMSTTVTGNMIPNFSAFFDVSPGLAQWLTSGATLISGVTIPLTAFLIKRVRNKTYFFAAMTAFTAGSLAAWLASSFPVLLMSRMLQAVGCGMLLPFAQVVLLKIYPKDRQGIVLAAYSMAAMVSSVVGPTYAGLIMDTFGWQGVFLSLFVLGLLISAAGIVFVKNVTQKEDAALNVPYMVLAAAGFASFVIGISNLDGGIFAWESGGLIVTGIALLACFSVFQLRSERPLLNLRVFRYRSFTVCVLLSLCMYLISMGCGMILPIYAKALCGYSDTAYGVATLLGSALSIAASLLAGKVYDKGGLRGLFVTGIAMFAAFSCLGFLFSTDTAIVYIAVVFALQSVAMSLLNSPTTALALGDLEGAERVDGSAIYNTLRQISSSLASTLSVLIFTLAGSNIPAVHAVFGYFLLVSAAAALTAALYLRRKRGQHRWNQGTAG